MMIKPSTVTVWLVVSTLVATTLICRAQTSSNDQGATPIKTTTHKIGTELVHIPAGEFAMGSDAGAEDPRLARRAKISRPFYLGRNAVEPEVFGAGVISSGEVFRGCFTPDGREFYFFKKVTPGREEYRIFVSRLQTDGNWSESVRLDLGGEHSDTYPAISKDGRRLAFASYRPAPGDKSAKPNANLWYVDRRGDGWGTPVFMAAASTLGYYHAWVEFGPDGALYFRRVTADYSRSVTMVARWNGREYAAPEPFEPVERWKNSRDDVRINGGSPGPDGRTIFFDVTPRNPQTGRFATSDIWVSFRKGEGWTEPRPLGAGVNKEGFDVFPFFSPDGKQMYFVRDFRTFYRIPLAEALKSVN